MIQSASSKDTDWKMIGWCLGAFIGGILVGAFLAGPAIQKMKDKKQGKKTETPPAKA